MSSLPPFLIFYLGAALVLVLPQRLQPVALLATPLVGALNLYGLPMGDAYPVSLLGYQLTLVHADKMSTLFGILFHLAAFLGIVFSLHVKDTMQHVAGLIYAGSALGAVYVGDLIGLFAFWEMLAVSSMFLVLARRTERATRSAMRYLLIQVLSGVILLAGVVVHVKGGGSLKIGFVGLTGVGGWLMFLALGIKSAFPMLHNWLTDAYPEATPTGTVFLSAFTTKVAVYALARLFPGVELLVYIGAAMTMFPIFYAVIENDLRRVLAYSMINQIGFMVCGIGLGTELAINGAISHAFNDVVFKGLLMMSMGAVLFRTGKINGSELGGLYKSMPITAGFCIVGAASISAFPLFSGFVSKSMVMVAALQEGHPIVWLALLFASAGVFHHAGIKIPYFAFFAHDSGIRVKEAPPNMLLAMGIAAAICIFNGSYPWVLYSLLPFPVDYAPYTAAHVLTQIQLLLFSALAFTVLMLTKIYPPELRSVNIDAEWVYRKLLPATARWFVAVFGPIDRGLRRAGLGTVYTVVRSFSRHHGPDGALARILPTGTMVFIVILLLAGYLVLYLARG